MKILVVLGTRPEVIKFAALVHALMHVPEMEVVLVNSGQHRDLAAQMLATFRLEARYNFCLMTEGQKPGVLCARAMKATADIIDAEKPDWLLVQGDTGSAAAAAVAGFYAGIRVGHVEAGLRTYDLESPWPEEFNRRVISLTSYLHFAPTTAAEENLLVERVEKKRVYVTGNTGIDTLLWMQEQVRGNMGAPFRERWKSLKSEKPLVLCTFHRREAFGQNLRGILCAVAEMATSGDANFILPLHPNPEVQSAAREIFSPTPPGLFLVPPLDYPEFIWLMDRATILLSDSGGVQEEAPTLGRPVLITREKTERPEAVAAGASLLVGLDKTKIIESMRDLLSNKERLASMRQPRPIYGDGQAAQRIISALKEHTT